MDNIHLGYREGIIWSDGTLKYTHDEAHFMNTDETLDELVCLWMPIPE